MKSLTNTLKNSSANRAALEAAIREGVELSLTAPQKHMVTFDAATGSAEQEQLKTTGIRFTLNQ